jgi:hypothetical protein
MNMQAANKRIKSDSAVYAGVMHKEVPFGG